MKKSFIFGMMIAVILLISSAVTASPLKYKVKRINGRWTKVLVNKPEPLNLYNWSKPFGTVSAPVPPDSLPYFPTKAPKGLSWKNLFDLHSEEEVGHEGIYTFIEGGASSPTTVEFDHRMEDVFFFGRTMVGLGWDLRGGNEKDHQRFNGSFRLFVGSENLQLFSAFGMKPLDKKITIHYDDGTTKPGVDESYTERWGIGASTQLWKVFPTLFDRGYVSLMIGQIARRPGSTNLAPKRVGLLFESYGDKNFGRIAVEENMLLGLSNGLTYSVSLRSYISIVRLRTDYTTVFFQVGAGFDVSDLEKSRVSVNLRIFVGN